MVASDLMLSFGTVTAADYTLPKAYRVHPSWLALFAGDANHAAGIISGVAQALNPPGPFQERDTDAVRQAFTSAYHAEVLRTRHEILTPYGWGLDEFLDKGPEVFGNGFESLKAELYFECDFLVAGYSGDHRARLFSVAHPGTTSVQDLHGFSAIGTGATNAIAWLLFHGLNFETPIAEAVYRMCEAKFFGEAAHGVGAKTFVSVLRPDYKPVVIKPAELREIRRVWRRSKAPVSKQTKAEIQRIIAARSEQKPAIYR